MVDRAKVFAGKSVIKVGYAATPFGQGKSEKKGSP